MSGPLFGIVPTGHPLITEPASTPSEHSFLYVLPSSINNGNGGNSRPYSHIVVMLLPGVNLPANTAAAIYLGTKQQVAAAQASGAAPDFRFLGGIGPGKESAMFNIAAAAAADGQQQSLVIGVSVEPADSVGQRLQEKEAARASSGGGAGGSSGKPDTVVLAQRIIQNAFNFLSSFSGQAGPGGVEVVPLKAFENWWKKFESRVRSDPSFLERQQD